MKKKLPVVLLTALTLSGCVGAPQAATVGEKVTTAISSVIDGHTYREIPWNIFLTKEDRVRLAEGGIQDLRALDVGQYDVAQTLLNVEEKIARIQEGVASDQSETRTSSLLPGFTQIIKDLFGTESAVSFFVSVLEHMDKQPFTYPDALDIVGLEQVVADKGNEWVLHLEWKALQDKEDFYILPFVVHLTDDGTFITGTMGTPKSERVYQRPLQTEALFSDTSHEQFIASWQTFSQHFNKGTKPDNGHLRSLARDGMSLSVLETLFEESRGDLKHAALTGWYMDDADAVPETWYTFSVPLDNDGTIATYNVLYNRADDAIVSLSRA